MYISMLSFNIQESQGRNLEAGTEAEAMEECGLLICSSLFQLPFSVYIAKGLLPTDGNIHTDCALAHQLTIKKI